MVRTVLYYVIYVLLVICLAGIIIFAFWPHKAVAPGSPTHISSGGSTVGSSLQVHAGNSTTLTNNANPTGGSSASTSTGSSSTASTSPLSNTGPGSTAWLFIGASIGGAIAYQAVLRYRLRRRLQ